MGNISNDTSEDLAEKVVVATMMTLLTLLTIFGNIMVVLAIFTYKPLRTVQNFFLVSLAVADLTVGVFVMPYHVANYIIGSWIFESLFCDVWLTCDILCCTASILNLCGISLDRYWAIHNPIQYAQKRSFKRVLMMVLIVWFVSALVSIPPLLGWRPGGDGSLYNHVTQQCRLTDDPGYVIYSSCGSFYIPLAIMSFVYIRIYMELRKRLRKKSKSLGKLREAEALSVCAENSHKVVDTENSNSNENDNGEPVDVGRCCGTFRNIRDDDSPRLEQKTSATKPRTCSTESHRTNSSGGGEKRSLFAEKQRISLSKERKAAKTLGTIMAAFVICWLPFFMMYLILPLCASCPPPPERFEAFVVWLGYINSALNPVIYTVCNNEFRRSLKYMIGQKRPKKLLVTRL